MEPETRPTGAAMSPGRWVVLILVAVVVIGLLLPAFQKVRDGPAYLYSLNNLKQIGIGLHQAADTYNGKLPPAAGAFATRDGTLFYHILPFIEHQHTWDKYDRTASIKTYSTYSDPTNRGENFLSYASNFSVFGRESRTLADITKTHGAANTVWLMERYAKVRDHEHRWPDTADGATWLVGGEVGFEVRPDPEYASNTTAHGFSQHGLCVGFADGSVRLVKPTVSQETFRWACEPARPTPEPPDWLEQQTGWTTWQVWLLVGVGVLVLLGLIVILRRKRTTAARA